MAELTLQEIIARLGAQDAELAALRTRLAAAERRERRRQRAPSLRRSGGALIVALLVALVPLSLLAANPFTDLTGGVHDPNIDAIYNAGVTTGCVPLPDPNPQYCPTANVTREEMASFLARLGGLGTNPPVANALKLQGYAPNGLVRAAAGPTSATLNLTNAPLGYGTLAITAPGSGFVLVNGAITFRRGAGGTCPCNASVQLRHVEAVAFSYIMSTTIGNPLGSRGVTSLAWVFPVAAGVNNFDMRINQSTDGAVIGDGTIVASTGHLTALFVPFGSTGGATLDLP